MDASVNRTSRLLGALAVAPMALALLAAALLHDAARVAGQEDTPTPTATATATETATPTLTATATPNPYACGAGALPAVCVLPVGQDWRVVGWPYAGRKQADQARELLASRGLRVDVVEF